MSNKKGEFELKTSKKKAPCYFALKGVFGGKKKKKKSVHDTYTRR